MITAYLQASQASVGPAAQNKQGDAAELSRLMAAAIINERFRELLLKDPRLALHQGFNGERFYLDPEQEERVLSIQASTLSEFAGHLAAMFSKNGHGDFQAHPNGKGRIEG